MLYITVDDVDLQHDFVYFTEYSISFVNPMGERNYRTK